MNNKDSDFEFVIFLYKS